MASASLQKLYDRIPKVEGCQPSCSGCCGPVPMIAEEASSVRHLFRPEPFRDGMAITPLKPACFDCAYSSPNGCSIYKDRPFMCRLFGTSVEAERLRCPHGARPKKPLSAREAANLTAEYVRIAKAAA